MEFDKGGNQIVVKRIKKGGHGHHGGAWKVAFADFATAMMAFFLLLWLLEAATPKQLKAISGYFNDPTAFTEGGSPYVIDMGGGLKDDEYAGDSPEETPESAPDARGIKIDEQTVEEMAQEIEARKMQELKRTLEARIEENPALQKFKDQIIMEITRDGLQIQIVDKESRPMFDSGSDVIKPYMNDILMALAETISGVPNRLSLSGHTDAQQFVDSPDYSNWELSADRANAARRSLLSGGVREDQLAQVVGLSSSVLFVKDDPNAPINRRISILVMNQDTDKALKEQQGGGGEGLPPDPDFDVPAVQETPVPAPGLESLVPAPQLPDAVAPPATAPSATTPPAAASPATVPPASTPFPDETDAAPGQTPTLNEAESFERMRKTMTQKNAEPRPAQPSAPPKSEDDDFF